MRNNTYLLSNFRNLDSIYFLYLKINQFSLGDTSCPEIWKPENLINVHILHTEIYYLQRIESRVQTEFFITFGDLTLIISQFTRTQK